MTAKRQYDQMQMTVEEFLNWDGGGHVGKLELVNGYVRAMAPASEAHSTIQLNIELRSGSISKRPAALAVLEPKLQ